MGHARAEVTTRTCGVWVQGTAASSASILLGKEEQTFGHRSAYPREFDGFDS